MSYLYYSNEKLKGSKVRITRLKTGEVEPGPGGRFRNGTRRKRSLKGKRGSVSFGFPRVSLGFKLLGRSGFNGNRRFYPFRGLKNLVFKRSFFKRP